MNENVMVYYDGEKGVWVASCGVTLPGKATLVAKAEGSDIGGALGQLSGAVMSLVASNAPGPQPVVAPE